MAIKKKKTSVPKFRPGARRRVPTTGIKNDAAKTRKSAKKPTRKREDFSQAAARIVREATEYR